MTKLLADKEIAKKILYIRGKQVMLDRDLAELYEVETRTLNQTVKRNLERFPDDFMFQLTKLEFENLISQSVISSWGGIRKMPFVFTEFGVLMLSSILKSDVAAQTNIRIIRVFVKMRELISTDTQLKKVISNLETKLTKRLDDHEDSLKVLFSAIKQLFDDPSASKKKIGFRKKN